MLRESEEFAMGDVIPRPLYMRKVKPFIGKQLVKVFVGQRRAGKSYLMRSVQDYLREQKSPPHIIVIDKERHEFVLHTLPHLKAHGPRSISLTWRSWLWRTAWRRSCRARTMLR